MHDVTFMGLAFAHDNFLVSDVGYASQDLDAQIPAAVSFQNTQAIVLDGVTVSQTSGSGVEFLTCGVPNAPAWCFTPPAGSSVPVATPATNYDTIRNAALYDIGAAAIRIGMGLNEPYDTDDNIPQHMTVEDTVIEGWGRAFPSAFGIAQGFGQFNSYTNNDVYDGYHVGISICACGSGPTSTRGPIGHLVQFNHVHDTHQGIMNDGGAVRIEDGNDSFVGSYNQILDNRVHDVSSASSIDGTNNDPACGTTPETMDLPCDGYGGDGIYLDQSGNVEVGNNLVYRVSENAVSFPKTPSIPGLNIVHNNILAFARGSMISDANPYPTNAATPNRTFVATSNIFLFDRKDTDAVPFYVQGGCTYPGLMGGALAPYGDYQVWTSNLYYRTDGGFATDGYAFHMQTSADANQICTANVKKWEWLYLGCDNGQTPCWQTEMDDPLSVSRDPGFPHEVSSTDDYSLPNGSPGVGFVRFDTAQAGRSNPRLQPPAVAPTFPTKPFRPDQDF
jgi:hypothetical protein